MEKMVIFPLKIVIFPLKMVIFPLKMVIYPLNMVIFHRFLVCLPEGINEDLALESRISGKTSTSL